MVATRAVEATEHVQGDAAAVTVLAVRQAVTREAETTAVAYAALQEEEGEENISSIINRNGTFNATSPALVCFISLFA